jgi:type IV pilus assembly protein PilM
VKSILSKAISKGPVAGLRPRTSARPPAAVEVSSLGVLAAAGQPPVYGFAPLAAGAVTPGVAEANLRAPAAVAEAIAQALNAVNPPKRAVSLVLPDTAVRVFVLDFDSLPSKASEALPILRFRLRKMVPFDVEHASVSYQVLTVKKNECRVLTAVMPGPVLAEYEAAVHAAGYEPGAVLPASLAALEAIEPGEAGEAALLVHLSPEALTTAIATSNDLLLYRTLELPIDPELRLSEIQRGVAVALAFYEDKTSAAPAKLHYTGWLEGGEFAQQIGSMGLSIVELAPRPSTGAATALGQASLAGATGALAGASK